MKKIKYVFKVDVLNEIRRRAKENKFISFCQIRNRDGKQYATFELRASMVDELSWSGSRKIFESTFKDLCPNTCMTSGSCYNATFRLNPDIEG